MYFKFWDFRQETIRYFILSGIVASSTLAQPALNILVNVI